MERDSATEASARKNEPILKNGAFFEIADVDFVADDEARRIEPPTESGSRFRRRSESAKRIERCEGSCERIVERRRFQRKNGFVPMKKSWETFRQGKRRYIGDMRGLENDAKAIETVDDERRRADFSPKARRRGRALIETNAFYDTHGDGSSVRNRWRLT